MGETVGAITKPRRAGLTPLSGVLPWSAPFRRRAPEGAGLEAGLELPDQDGCHVRAAAITTSAQVIVAVNLKDFPSGIFDKFEEVALCV